MLVKDIRNHRRIIDYFIIYSNMSSRAFGCPVIYLFINYAMGSVPELFLLLKIISHAVFVIISFSISCFG